MTTVNQQVAQLKEMARPRLLAGVRYVIVMLMATFATLALAGYHGVFFFLALMATVAFFNVVETAGHVSDATKALEHGSTKKATVHIGIDSGSDSETFQAMIRMPSGVTWKFDFRPVGWMPVAGEHEALLYCHPDIAWPALAVTPQGIIVPSSHPLMVA